VPQPIGFPMGFAAVEFEVTGADVRETIAWAEATAGADRTYTLYAVAQCAEGELGLLRLAGADPLSTPHPVG
jgi:hypothetical protein